MYHADDGSSLKRHALAHPKLPKIRAIDLGDELPRFVGSSPDTVSVGLRIELDVALNSDSLCCSLLFRASVRSVSAVRRGSPNDKVISEPSTSSYTRPNAFGPHTYTLPASRLVNEVCRRNMYRNVSSKSAGTASALLAPRSSSS